MHGFIRLPQVVNARQCILKSYYASPGKCVCGLRHHSVVDHSSIQVRLLAISSANVNFQINNKRSQLYVCCPTENDVNFSSLILARNLSLTSSRYDKEPLKPSSKVEATVQEIKKKKKEEIPAKVPSKAVVKKSIKQKIIDEIVHYYHGFRLLFIDIKISSVLVYRILNGNALSRREYRLLIRTVGDMFRLVPFSVFIIVPFMELLLPVFIKFFPNMLPSTFQSATDKEEKLQQNLKVKLEMAKFLQHTLDDMSLQHKDRSSVQAKEFTEWFQKVRTSGDYVSNADILKYAKLFEDEITLDSLSRSQLVALCRVLEVQTLGTNYLLRFQLRMKLRSLAADDKMIQKEGVDSLTLSEVQQACRARGMRAYGISEARLRQQLSQWLDLSLNEKVPPSLLLLSRALMLPEAIPTSDKLKATISALPDTVVTQTKAAIGEKEGKIDNKVKIEVIKEEERKIKEERKEQVEEKKRQEEVLVDKAPILTDSATRPMQDTAKVISIAAAKPPSDNLHTKDLEVLETAIDSISKEKKLMVEKEEIEDLKEELADYSQDVQELKAATADEAKPKIKETIAAQRLYKKVNSMIGKMDTLMQQLQSKEKKLKKDLETSATDKTKEELLKIDDIMAAIRQIKNVPDESRIAQLQNILGKMDDDHDGAIKVEDVLKVIEVLGKDNVHLSAKQVDELIDLLDKEEILEVEDKIEKALMKEKDEKIEKALKKEKDAKTKSQSNPATTKSEATASKTGSGVDTIISDGQPQKDKANNNQIPKPKVEAKSSIITPPVTSIDQTKKKDNSKML